MSKSVKGLRIGSLFILWILAGFLYFPLKEGVRESFWLYAQAPNQNADLENPNFDFSVYYTGNVRGNLEPCG